MSYLWYWPDSGWDFDAWNAAHSWAPLQSPQSGSADLLPPVDTNDSLADWQAQRAYWQAVSENVLGRTTDLPPRRMRHEVLETVREGAYRRQRIRYTLTSEESGFAWLLLPDKSERPRPVVIALHQTVAQGKDEAVGIEGDPELAYGKELAEQGFVVFAPDVIGFGERKGESPEAVYRSAEDFFGRHPEGSVMGKMAWDVQRACDLLELLPEVDATKIGCIGHSHGGYGTLFAMIAEPRIGAGVISCGVTALRADPVPQRWWRNTALIPRLGYCEDNIASSPIDFHLWLSLVAPRTLLLSVALNDAIFPNTGIFREVSSMLARLYTLHGKEDHFVPKLFDGAHQFPREVREQAYALFARTLG